MDIDSGFGLYKLKEKTISYISLDSVNKLWIMGDFSGWEPIEMIKNSNKLFTYNINLLEGFQYFYCFTAQNEVIVDFHCEYAENYRNG